MAVYDIVVRSYVDLRTLSSVIGSRIYALFVVKSTSVPKLGGGGQNFESARWFLRDVYLNIARKGS